MTQRISEVVRNTNETKIRVRVNLDGTGQGTLNTGVPFLDHMIDQIKRHGLFDIDIHCDGDLEIDDHHTVEDCGITLGQAFAQALGHRFTESENTNAAASRRIDEVLQPIEDRLHALRMTALRALNSPLESL